MDRLALIAWCWFVLLVGLGLAVGDRVGAPATGALLGFFFALFGTFAWPWVLPKAIHAWIDHDRG
jgi:hypothetical protein